MVVHQVTAIVLTVLHLTKYQSELIQAIFPCCKLLDTTEIRNVEHDFLPFKGPCPESKSRCCLFSISDAEHSQIFLILVMKVRSFDQELGQQVLVPPSGIRMYWNHMESTDIWSCHGKASRRCMGSLRDRGPTREISVKDLLNPFLLESKLGVFAVCCYLFSNASFSLVFSLGPKMDF